jgi:hypothetical protein
MKSEPVYWFLFAVLMQCHLCGQGKAVVQINSSIAVQFIVTDPRGRMTGVDPRGSGNPELGREINEIPGANYSTSGLGDSPENDEPQDSDFSHEFMYTLPSPEGDGKYEIEVIGVEPCVYSLFIDISPAWGSHVQSFRKTIKGLTDKDQVTQFQLEYAGDASKQAMLSRVVSPVDLRQDLDNSFKLKLLGGYGFYKELSNREDNFEKHLSKKDTSAAVKELEGFRATFTKEYEKGIKPNGNRFITADAWKILSDDTQYLADRLQSKSRPGRK